MRVVINHDTCQHGGAFADRCLAATIRHPLGHERHCTAEAKEDGRPELTVVLIADGHAHTLVLRTPAEQEIAASEGWLALADSPAM